MGRRRKGRDVTGWLIVDKPSGPTSTAVVNKVRWALDARKAGHAGTLDPAATGVLAVALGEATKTVPHVTDALKCYRFTMRLGAATNTDDAEGEVIASAETRPDDAAIAAALPAFRGDILQVPPQFSAVKIDGERAYARARFMSKVWRLWRGRIRTRWSWRWSAARAAMFAPSPAIWARRWAASAMC